MPPVIHHMPDSGLDPAGTRTVPTGQGPLQAAWAPTGGGRTSASKDPWQTPIGAVAQLSTQNTLFATVPATLFLSAVWSRTDDTAARLLACAVVAGLFVALVALQTGWRLGCTQGMLDHADVASSRAHAAAAAARLQAARKMAFKLARQPLGEGYLYVVEFSTGTVKVGQSEDPKVRLATHRREADAFGVHVVDYWISPSHMNFRDNETRLINQCLKVSHRSRKEYFHGVGFLQAVGFANALTYYSSNANQVSVAGVWA